MPRRPWKAIVLTGTHDLFLADRARHHSCKPVLPFSFAFFSLLRLPWWLLFWAVAQCHAPAPSSSSSVDRTRASILRQFQALIQGDAGIMCVVGAGQASASGMADNGRGWPNHDHCPSVRAARFLPLLFGSRDLSPFFHHGSSMCLSAGRQHVDSSLRQLVSSCPLTWL